MKKILYLSILILSTFIFTTNLNATSGTNHSQYFKTGETQIIPTMLDNYLGHYDMAYDTKFYQYTFSFDDVSLETGKSYHVKISVYGSISDGFYSFSPKQWSFKANDVVNFSSPVAVLPMYNVALTGSGVNRFIEFDFLNSTDYRNYALVSVDNGVPLLYWSWSGASRFGFTDLVITPLTNASNDTTIIQNDIIINQNNQTNNSLNNINSNITNEDGPELTGLSGSAGWLPPGPVDSILNLPLSLMQNLTTNLSKSCSPLILTLPYVDRQISLPCINTIYTELGINGWLTVIGTIASAFILYKYLLSLYKWVDDTLTFRENTWNDWGGV